MGDAVNAGDIVVTEGFAWCPAMANNRGIINYGTKEGDSIYRANISCLYSDKTNLFSAKPEGLQGFLNHLTYRAKSADWAQMLTVPIDYTDDESDELSILTNYGQFTLEYLEEYVRERHLLLNDRWQQDNFQCQTCIFASLSEEALNTINLCSDEFTTSNQVQSLLLIKIIIRESRVETPHRTRIIRQNLSALDSTIQKYGYDIDKFNTYVLGQIADLTAMGERTQDILANLFKAYLSAPDEEFKMYISHKQSLCDEGEDINYAYLMVLAGNKYKGRVEAGTWNAPNKDQVKLLALEAKLEQMKKLIPTGTSENKSNGTTKRKDNEVSNSNSNKKPFQRAAWRLVEPTALEIKNNHTKKVEGKVYKWCDNHQWCAHHTKECNGTSKPKANDATKPKSENDEQKVNMVAAFNAITADQTDDEDE